MTHISVHFYLLPWSRTFSALGGLFRKAQEPGYLHISFGLFIYSICLHPPFSLCFLLFVLWSQFICAGDDTYHICRVDVVGESPFRRYCLDQDKPQVCIFVGCLFEYKRNITRESYLKRCQSPTLVGMASENP